MSKQPKPDVRAKPPGGDTTLSNQPSNSGSTRVKGRDAANGQFVPLKPVRAPAPVKPVKKGK